jgi:hypothetical protein
MRLPSLNPLSMMFRWARPLAAVSVALFVTGPAPVDPARARARLEQLSLEGVSIPADLIAGTLVRAVRWRDANGENLLVLSQRRSTRTAREDALDDDDEGSFIELQAVHSVRKGSSTRVLRRVRDSSSVCAFDNNTKFLVDSLEVTDLDANGLGEVTFAYFVQCTSDVSPATLKLLLLENGKKFIIRGTNFISIGEGATEGYGGERNIDPSFNGAPRTFMEHALSRWGRYVRRASW